MLIIIFIGAFFPILLNTVYGVSSVRSTLIDSARVLGASERDISPRRPRRLLRA